MEDNDNAINAAGGRVGYWYTFNDGTEGATQEPPPDPEGTGETPFTMTALEPARGQSTYAARSWGSGFEEWGAGFGFDLNSPEGEKASYDASAYTGITFWAKGTARGATVMISDPGTDPAGSVCTDECDKWQKSLTLTEEWQQFTIPFADLKQGGWGTPAGADQIDASKLYSIQFQVGVAPEFDVYIDDLGFYN
ncbi:CIA30 family protein [Sorangium sp. So ce406]|uniref:CIA30 family protein n=1 Tax=Sorangium sp. So ce406 TaxID=3133311 RepID=UPI003F5CB22B